MIRKLICTSILLLFSALANADSLKDDIKENINTFLEKSNWELAVSLGSYHDRSYYSKKDITSFNERNAGYGLGLVYTSKAQNEHSVKYMFIKDSNYQDQHLIGYQYMYNVLKKDVDIQVGLLAGITSRKMIRDNKTIVAPFVLPAIGMKAWNVKLNLTYIPEMKYNSEKYGGFAYLFGTYEFK